MFSFFYHLWTDGVWRCLAIGGSSVEVSCGSCGSARLMNELLLAAAEVDTERQKNSAVRSSPRPVTG